MKIRTMLPFAMVSAALLAAPGAAQDGGRPLSASLTGAVEVPGPGDTDGSGSAKITVNAGQGQVCFELMVSDIETATMAHIHRGGVGVAGPVVVNLAAPASGSAKGCTDVDRALAQELIRTPAAFYVNVHNAPFPAGAVRGQLGK